VAYYRLYSDAQQATGSPPLGTYYDVTNYEATGDGETDDRLAILAALLQALITKGQTS
jgi:hypothetical protein